MASRVEPPRSLHNVDIVFRILADATVLIHIVFVLFVVLSSSVDAVRPPSNRLLTIWETAP